jgi:hypothetical protein
MLYYSHILKKKILQIEKRERALRETVKRTKAKERNQRERDLTEFVTE